MVLRREIIFLLLGATVLFGVDSAEAQNRGATGDRRAVAGAKLRDCAVGVRVIQGSNRAAHFQRGRGKRVQVHSFVADLSKQLEPLPFAEYEPLGHDTKRLTLGEKGVFRVKTKSNEKHILSVVPHAVSHGKVHLTVDWRGPANEQLLSTKLRVINGKCMVVGTDSGKDTSTILSIRVKCD